MSIWILKLFIIFQFFVLFSECKKNETNFEFLNDYGQYADNRMKAIGEYFSDLMGCGPEGWCAFRCCPIERMRSNGQRRYFPNPASASRNQLSEYRKPMNRYPYISRNPSTATTTAPTLLKQCANACMPQCTPRCLERYGQIVSSFMSSLTAIDVMGQPVVNEHAKNIRFSPTKKVECRDECMPYCTPQCLDAYAMADQHTKPKICKPVCMPQCNDECVAAPPLMVPCVFDSVCHCPAGYVRCSEMTCCMKYKTMAIRYNNRMSSMSFSDDDDNHDGANQTSVYMSELRKMGSSPDTIINSPKIVLPSNSTIVYYPEQGKAEIMKNDGTVVVEVMESSSRKSQDN